MLFQRLFFSAGVKRTLTECNRNQFFFFLFYICTLFLYHHGRWNLLIRVKSRSVWHGEKKKKTWRGGRRKWKWGNCRREPGRGVGLNIDKVVIKSESEDWEGNKARRPACTWTSIMAEGELCGGDGSSCPEFFIADFAAWRLRSPGYLSPMFLRDEPFISPPPRPMWKDRLGGNKV